MNVSAREVPLARLILQSSPNTTEFGMHLNNPLYRAQSSRSPIQECDLLGSYHLDTARARNEISAAERDTHHSDQSAVILSPLIMNAQPYCASQSERITGPLPPWQSPRCPIT